MAAVVLVLFMAGFVSAIILGASKSLRYRWREKRIEGERKKDEKKRALLREALGWYDVGDLNKARTKLKSLLSMDPNYLEALVLMGEMARKEGRKEEALSFHRKAVRAAEKDPWALHQLYLDYSDTKEWEEALSILEELTKEAKPSRDVLKELMSTHLELGQADKALTLQEKILKMTPKEEREKETRKLSWMLYQKARSSNDTTLLYKLFKKNPAFTPACLALTEKGDEKDRKTKPSELLKKACEANPRVMIIFDKLEEIFMTQEKPAELINLYLRLADSNPSNQLLPFALARLYFSLGMYKDAKKAISSLEIESPPVLFLKGLILERLEERDEAFSLFQKALGKDLCVHYVCEQCGCTSLHWREECPNCGEGGTLVVEF
jgi:tetratricopeptide (TPR) repeat protein